MNIKLFNKLQAAVISEGVAIDSIKLSTSVISETLPETRKNKQKLNKNKIIYNNFLKYTIK